MMMNRSYWLNLWAKRLKRWAPMGLTDRRSPVKFCRPSLPPVSHVKRTELSEMRTISDAAIVTMAR
jgi:hypothetical protein